MKQYIIKLFKNKIALWVMFVLFVTWFLMGFLDGAPESWTQNDTEDVFLKSIALVFFIIAALSVLKIVSAFPWKKAPEESIIMGFFLSLFFLAIFFYHPYSSVSSFVSYILDRIIQPEIYRGSLLSYFFDFETLLFFVFWLSGTAMTLFSALVYLGILKVPSFRWQLPDRIKIGKIQIMLGIFLFVVAFIGLLWVERVVVPSIFMNAFEAPGDVREDLEELYPAAFEEPQLLDMTNYLVVSDITSTFALFGLTFTLGCIILCVLSLMLLLKGIINIQPKES